MRKPGRAAPSPAIKPGEIAIENSFARVLAHNDVKMRNKGIKKLRVRLPPAAKRLVSKKPRDRARPGWRAHVLGLGRADNVAAKTKFLIMNMLKVAVSDHEI